MVHIGISLPFSVRSPQHFQACVVLLKDFFNQIYQSKDFLRLTYFKVSTFLHTGPSSKKCIWSPNILNPIAQSLIKITQKTSINAIGVDGIKFSNKETEFFNFWFMGKQQSTKNVIKFFLFAILTNIVCNFS